MSAKKSRTDMLQRFTKRNPHAVVTYDKNIILIEKPWGKDDVRITCEAKDKAFIKSINSVYLNPIFIAVFHPEKKLIEFLYTYLDPSSESNKDVIDRKFQVNFEGNVFDCFYAEPTYEFLQISKYSEYGTIPEYSSSIFEHLRVFKDGQSLKKMPGFMKDFFKNKIPRNFFIQASIELDKFNVEQLARHINFLSKYYDRRTPVIEINNEDSKQKTQKMLRYIEKAGIPKNLIVRPIDDVILKLLEVAITTSPRFSFIYYYQIFEFAGFHYIDKEIKGKVRNLLRDPAMLECADEKFSEFYSLLTDGNLNDNEKIKKVIENYCDPKVIWREIENNKNFFSSRLDFDGGLSIDALIPPTLDENGWCGMWTPKLFDQITKIRNALVHAREKRENCVILPTKKNHFLLNQYLPVIARTAEQIALKTD